MRSSILACCLVFAVSLSAAEPVIRVALVMDAALPADVAAAAVAEAATIWRPYGVEIISSRAPRRVSDPEAPRLPVRIAKADPSSPAFASIEFLADGQPKPLILLYYDAVKKVVAPGAHLGSLREDEWPQALRNGVLGRAVGRAVAHEIGHWLLRTPAHSLSGLMRAKQTADDLIGFSRDHYRLTANDLGRLSQERERLMMAASGGGSSTAGTATAAPAR